MRPAPEKCRPVVRGEQGCDALQNLPKVPGTFIVTTWTKNRILYEGWGGGKVQKVHFRVQKVHVWGISHHSKLILAPGLEKWEDAYFVKKLLSDLFCQGRGHMFRFLPNLEPKVSIFLEIVCFWLISNMIAPWRFFYCEIRGVGALKFAKFTHAEHRMEKNCCLAIKKYLLEGKIRLQTVLNSYLQCDFTLKNDKSYLKGIFWKPLTIKPVWKYLEIHF